MDRSNSRNNWASDIISTCRVIIQNGSSKIAFQEQQCFALTSLARSIQNYVAKWIRILHQVRASHSEGNLWRELRRILERGAQLIRLCKERNCHPVFSAALFCKGEISEVIDDALKYAQMINRFILLKSSDQRGSVDKLMVAIESDCKDLQLHLRRAYRWRSESENSSLQIDDAHLKINQKLGNGCFGNVKSAIWHEKLPVAVKEFASLEHFMDELDLFQYLQQFDDNSPHILQMFGYTSSNRLVLELMDRDLKTHIMMMGENRIHWDKLQKLKDIEEHKIEWENWQELRDQLEKFNFYPGKMINDWGYEESAVIRSVEVMLQIAKAMKHLHSIDIAHRDLKPSNVLIKVRKDGSLLVKLADFGISKKKFMTIGANTDMRGTVMYMAPEVLEGTENYSRKIDVYSYGLICAEIITGKICRKKPSQMQQLTKEEQMAFLPKSIPKKLQTLISSCLEYEAHKRPSFDDICDSLWLVMEQVLTYNQHTPTLKVEPSSRSTCEKYSFSLPAGCGGGLVREILRKSCNLPCESGVRWRPQSKEINICVRYPYLEQHPWISFKPELSINAPLIRRSPELFKDDISQESEEEYDDLRLWFDGFEL